MIPIRVYYEDTDLAGIVYYANYLRFIERGRTEFCRDAGIDQIALRERQGLVFAVRRLTAAYHAPARFDDALAVGTRLTHAGGARLAMHQTVWRGDSLLFEAEVELACIGEKGRPSRVPAEIREALARLASARSWHGQNGPDEVL